MSEQQLQKDIIALQNNQAVIIDEQYLCVLNHIENAYQIIIENKKIIALIPDAFWLLQYCAMPPLEPENAFDNNNEYYTSNAIGLSENLLDHNLGITFILINTGYTYALLKRLQAPLLGIAN
jgi:hypothetical protein